MSQPGTVTRSTSLDQGYPGLHSLALVLASQGADLPQLEEKFRPVRLPRSSSGRESWIA